MSEHLRCAIVGCGWVAPAHAAALSLTPGAKLVATCDHHRASAQRLGERFGADATDNYAELLSRDDVDIVCICLPQHLHYSATVDALQAGKHVLCEKPMAMTLQECDAMIEAATHADRQLGRSEEHT